MTNVYYDIIELLMQKGLVPHEATSVRIEASVDSKERVVYEWEKLQAIAVSPQNHIGMLR